MSSTDTPTHSIEIKISSHDQGPATITDPIVCPLASQDKCTKDPEDCCKQPVEDSVQATEEVCSKSAELCIKDPEDCCLEPACDKAACEKSPEDCCNGGVAIPDETPEVEHKVANKINGVSAVVVEEPKKEDDVPSVEATEENGSAAKVEESDATEGGVTLKEEETKVFVEALAASEITSESVADVPKQVIEITGGAPVEVKETEKLYENGGCCPSCH